jgi:hypothetical protein
MKREEVLSLLKELLIACETMRLAPIVSLTPNANMDRWKLSMKWVTSGVDKGCFDKILGQYGLVASETEDGYTIFQKPQV